MLYNLWATIVGEIDDHYRAEGSDPAKLAGSVIAIRRAGSTAFRGGLCAPVAVALAKAYVRPGEMIWVPFAIYADDRMVGFTELAFEPDSSDQYWIYHFFIDQRYQGQGFGTQALHATVDMIKNSYCTCQAIQVTVHQDNAPAQHLYTALGFTPTGKMADGEPVYRYKV